MQVCWMSGLSFGGMAGSLARAAGADSTIAARRRYLIPVSNEILLNVDYYVTARSDAKRRCARVRLAWSRRMFGAGYAEDFAEVRLASYTDGSHAWGTALDRLGRFL